MQTLTNYAKLMEIYIAKHKDLVYIFMYIIVYLECDAYLLLP